jgi:hypothetical protein
MEVITVIDQSGAIVYSEEVYYLKFKHNIFSIFDLSIHDDSKNFNYYSLFQ